jgi:hypothetical protein
VFVPLTVPVAVVRRADRWAGVRRRRAAEEARRRREAASGQLSLFHIDVGFHLVDCDEPPTHSGVEVGRNEDRD